MSSPTIAPYSPPALKVELKRIIPDEPLPEDGEVEADGDEESVKTSASIYNSGGDKASLLAEYHGYVENGRLYQATRDGDLLIPSDDIQYESMEANHLTQLMLDCHQPNPLFRAPIRPDPKYILDLGTGQGHWAIEVADKYPTAKVHGIDLFPPPQKWVPPNCTLAVDDFTQPWNWPQNQKFDLIHGRTLIGCVSDKEWKEVYREAYEHLAPGGWIERLEVDITVRCDDGTMPLDSALATIVETFNQAAEDTENSVNTADTMRSFIEGAGFINVHEKVTKTPIGPWAKHPIYKQAGGIYMISFKIGLEGWIMHLLTKHGKPKPWTVEEVQDHIKKITRELDQGWHIYQLNRRIWAQKPLDQEGNKASKRRRRDSDDGDEKESPRPPRDARESAK